MLKRFKGLRVEVLGSEFWAGRDCGQDDVACETKVEGDCGPKVPEEPSVTGKRREERRKIDPGTAG